MLIAGLAMIPLLLLGMAAFPPSCLFGQFRRVLAGIRFPAAGISPAGESSRDQV